MEYYTARESDYEFAYELKKAAEYHYIKEIFGWDDALQRKLHQQEWEEAKPQIMIVDGERVGSFLIQEKTDHLYFGRFFILPQFQGRGLGKTVLNHLNGLSAHTEKPCKLLYLQGNWVGELYRKFGFIETHQTSEFIYMTRPRVTL